MRILLIFFALLIVWGCQSSTSWEGVPRDWDVRDSVIRSDPPPQLIKIIKENMHDPQSFEHIKTLWWRNYGKHGKLFKTRIYFKGKNAFNATVDGWLMANVNSNGEIVNLGIFENHGLIWPIQ